jgi:hypothetical protein
VKHRTTARIDFAKKNTNNGINIERTVDLIRVNTITN